MFLPVRIGLLAALLLQAGTEVSAQDSTEVEKAKAFARQVDARLEAMKTVKRLVYKKVIEQELTTFTNYRTSVLDASFENNRLVKITVQSEGDMEALLTEYYYTGNTLVLVKKELLVYDGLIAANAKLLRRKKFLYCLKNRKLVTCLYNDNIAVDYGASESNKKGDELLRESEAYTKELSY